MFNGALYRQWAGKFLLHGVGSDFVGITAVCRAFVINKAAT